MKKYRPRMDTNKLITTNVRHGIWKKWFIYNNQNVILNGAQRSEESLSKRQALLPGAYDRGQGCNQGNILLGHALMLGQV
jgi:hypothetical protein